MSNILCTICARGGSKGVKNKNIRLLNGKPLIAYTIDQAQQSKLFDHVVISTDSDDIANKAKEYGAEVFFKRDEVMASDTAGKLEVIRDAFVRSEEYYGKKYDYLMDLDATAPIRKVEDIVKSFEYLKQNNFENLVTAVNARKSPYFNQLEIQKDGKISLSKKPKVPILSRQTSPKIYDMNASIYIWTRNGILNQKEIVNDKTGLYVMDEISMYDIDTEVDFKIVQMLMEDINV